MNDTTFNLAQAVPIILQADREATYPAALFMTGGEAIIDLGIDSHRFQQWCSAGHVQTIAFVDDKKGRRRSLHVREHIQKLVSEVDVLLNIDKDRYLAEAAAERQRRKDLIAGYDWLAAGLLVHVEQDGHICFATSLSSPHIEAIPLQALLAWPEPEPQDFLAFIVAAKKAVDKGFRTITSRFEAKLTKYVAAHEAKGDHDENDSILFYAMIDEAGRASRLAVKMQKAMAKLEHDANTVLGHELHNIFERATLNFRRTIDGRKLRVVSGISRYVDLFPAARAIKRTLHLYVGPTNSGKTHAAVMALKQAATGTYLAPLRLMALETFERLNGDQIACHLRTGEEIINVESAQHVSSTVEMADLNRPVEVAVIDEIQLLGNRERGFAWTQAAVGIPAQHVFMTGSADAIPLVRRIAEMTGDTLEIRHFERKTPLVASRDKVTLRDLQKGDCLVAFSRAAVLQLRAELQRHFEISVIYGALSPEVRRLEAARFRAGETDILIATDAIAMGLNLPIDRIIFSSLEKYDGICLRQLYAAEIRQIAGRAGRFGMSQGGVAAVLAGNKTGPVSKALESQPADPKDHRLYIMAPWPAVEAASRDLATDNLHKILTYIDQTLLFEDLLLKPADISTSLIVASALQNSGLDLRHRYAYLSCPVYTRDGRAMYLLSAWARQHARGEQPLLPPPRLGYAPLSDAHLEACEGDVRVLSMYLWLSQRWPAIYTQVNEVSAARNLLNGWIETYLARKKKPLRMPKPK